MKELIKTLLTRRSARTAKMATKIASQTSEMLPWQGDVAPKRQPSA